MTNRIVFIDGTYDFRNRTFECSDSIPIIERFKEIPTHFGKQFFVCMGDNKCMKVEFRFYEYSEPNKNLYRMFEE